MPSLAPSVRLAIAAASATLAVLCAFAVAAQDSAKLYAGVGVGVTDFKSEHAGIGYDDTPAGWQLYGGLQAREGMAVELAIEHLPGIEADDLLGSGIERLRISADHSAVIVRGLFSLSLEEVLRRRQMITVFGTLGIAGLLEERTVTELTTSRVTSTSERQTALVLGAGVSFDLARMRLRTYLQSADRAEGRLNSLGIAAEFRF